MWAQRELLLTKDNVTRATTECPNNNGRSQNNTPSMAPFSRDQSATRWKVDYSGTSHIMEVGVICPHGNSFYYRFRFASITLLPTLLFIHLQNTLFITIVSHTIPLQTQELILLQMKYGRRNRPKAFTGLILFPNRMME